MMPGFKHKIWLRLGVLAHLALAAPLGPCLAQGGQALEETEVVGTAVAVATADVSQYDIMAGYGFGLSIFGTGVELTPVWEVRPLRKPEPDKEVAPGVYIPTIKFDWGFQLPFLKYYAAPLPLTQLAFPFGMRVQGKIISVAMGYHASLYHVTESDRAYEREYDEHVPGQNAYGLGMYLDLLMKIPNIENFGMKYGLNVGWVNLKTRDLTFGEETQIGAVVDYAFLLVYFF